MKQRWIVLVIGSVLVTTACAGTKDEDMRLIVPFEAGTATDTVARALAPCLGERLGTGMVVENRPGEQGVLATREFVESGADGRALLVTPVGPPVVAPVVDPEVGYDLDDFYFAGVAHSAPLILFTAGNSPFDSAETLLGAARAGGASVEVAHTGASMTEELTVGELNILEETRLEPRQVDSDAELLRGVVAGDYPAGLTTISADHLAKVESGDIRVLAVGGEIRPSYLPDTLTFYRLTRANMLPKIPIDTAVIGPANPSDEMHLALSGALDKCLRTKDVQRDIGADFVPAELMTHGELLSRYWDLQRLVDLAQNRLHLEGN
jgi:tripartite-type tricarboxylate transporter receptor subunit TctC